MAKKAGEFWQFVEAQAGQAGTGEFVAAGLERLEHKYLPLVNEAGMFSWASPQLHGSPAASYHEFLGFPLTSEDFAHSLLHRGFWLVSDRKEVFSLSDISPDGLKAHLAGRGGQGVKLQAGPGWMALTREDPRGRFSVTATLWCPEPGEDKLEVMSVKVTNTSRRRLKLHPFAAIPVYGRSGDRLRDHRNLTAFLHRFNSHTHGVTLRPCMSFDERGHKENRLGYTILGFGPRGAAPKGIWRQQRDFIGEGGNYAAPAAVYKLQDAPASKKVTEGGEAVGAFRFGPLSLGPGRSAQFVLLSGISDDPKAPGRWQRRLRSAPGKFVAASLADTKAIWQERIHRISFRTADGELNNWLAWVNLQPILRRIYGNSYLPDFDYGRGGRGWRDLWQDCLALLLSDPAGVRGLLLNNFGGIRIDGSNATVIGADGSFIADRNNIPRTWMDHGVWPTVATLLYVDQTGDAGILLRPREYYRDHLIRRCKQVNPDWTEADGVRLLTRGGKVYRGTIFEHMLVQTLTAFFNVGEHNLCRLEDADWNDGMDMGPDRGESVAFSAYYAWNLRRLALAAEALAACGGKYIEVAAEMLALLDRTSGGRRVNYRSAAAKQRRLGQYLDAVAGPISGRKVRVGPAELAKDLRAKSDDLTGRIRKEQWVTPARGLGYFNGYYDNRGRRVGGRRGGRLSMSLTGQAFTVAGGVATDEQIDSIIRSANRLLGDPNYGGLRLNTDFGTVQMDLGRAFGFQYGEKENGGVFCHMAVMYAYGLYHRRRAAAGRKVWAALASKAIDQSIARILPGLPEYFNAAGRGKYCYLTGSASWLIYLLLTQVYGVRGDWGDLVLDPQLTVEDFCGADEVTVKAHFAGRPLVITYQNPDHLPAGEYRVESVTLAGGRRLRTTPLPDGGVRIARATIRRLSKDQASHLLICLTTNG